MEVRRKKRMSKASKGNLPLEKKDRNMMVWTQCQEADFALSQCIAEAGPCLLPAPRQPLWHSACSLVLEALTADVTAALKTAPLRTQE